MQIIKKYWYMLVLVIILIVAICFYVKSNKKEEIKNNNNNTDSKIVASYATHYFENFVEVVNINEYNVTVRMLKSAVTNQLADYNMEELNKCDDDSFVKFTLKDGENGYESYESSLNCQK